jgi:hypothetical protein
VLLILLLIYLFSTVRALTIGEGSLPSPPLPEFITGFVPSPPPVPAVEVTAACRTGDRLTVSAESCTLLVEPTDERRRLTLFVEQGSLKVLVRYEPASGEDPDSQDLPQRDERRAEFAVPDDRRLQVQLACVTYPLGCVLRIE